MCLNIQAEAEYSIDTLPVDDPRVGRPPLPAGPRGRDPVVSRVTAATTVASHHVHVVAQRLQAPVTEMEDNVPLNTSAVTIVVTIAGCRER